MPTNSSPPPDGTEINVAQTPVRTYLIGPRTPPGAGSSPQVSTLSAQAMQCTLNSIPGVTIKKTLTQGPQVRAFSANTLNAPDMVVAEIDDQRAEMLKLQHGQHLIIEEDHHLDYEQYAVWPGYAQTYVPAYAPPAVPAFPTAFGWAPAAPQPAFYRQIPAAPQPAPARATAPRPDRRRVHRDISPIAFKIKVVDSAGKPLAGVKVDLAGDPGSVSATTGKDGNAELELYHLPGRPLRALHVDGAKEHWDFFRRTPQLDPGRPNTVRLYSFAETVPGFPGDFRYGYGQRMMGLDKMGDELDGEGVKIAIVDSGCDTSHPLLKHIKHGKDLTPGGDGSWTDDVIGHGTHCAGVIAASGVKGMRGFAPKAEIHVLKVFPGGQYSSLIEALKYCIDNDIDVVNMSLGGPERSENVEVWLKKALSHGVSLILAAGNSSGPVQFPASSDSTLAVSAIGNAQFVPCDTWHSSTIIPNMLGADGTFSPSFTCHGPEVNVCAPGVGIVSTYPGKSFQAESGTSMAAPHVSGLAALLLAHNSAFKTHGAHPAGADKVGMLYSLVRTVCVPFAFGPERTGLGMPSLLPWLGQRMQAQLARKAEAQANKK